MTVSRLSLLQEEYWRRERRSPGAFATMLRGFDVTGPLDPHALELALAELPRRHEILGARFGERDGEPFQILDARPPVPLLVEDLRGGRSEVARRTAAELATPFDLTAGPPLRAALLRLTSAEHVLLLAVHHIVADGWSMGILLADLGACYAAFTQDEEPPPLPESARYDEFVAWQREEVAERLPAALEYWRLRLAIPSQPLGLPAHRPRAGVRTYDNGRLLFELGPELSTRLADAGTAERVTPFLLLLTAFQAALGRLTGSDDVAVASLFAGRDRPELEALVGLVANLTVFRTSLSGDPSFRELLVRVRSELFDAYEHQVVPLGLVAERLGEAEALHGLFDVWFNLLPERDELELTGTTVRPHPEPERPYRKDERCWDGDNLTVALSPAGDIYQGVVDYNARLLDRDGVAQVVDCFRSTLADALVDPSQRLFELTTPDCDLRLYDRSG